MLLEPNLYKKNTSSRKGVLNDSKRGQPIIGTLDISTTLACTIFQKQVSSTDCIVLSMWTDLTFCKQMEETIEIHAMLMTNWRSLKIHENKIHEHHVKWLLPVVCVTYTSNKLVKQQSCLNIEQYFADSYCQDAKRQ